MPLSLSNASTPQARLISLLESATSCAAPDQSAAILSEALSLAKGLDPYLEQCSSTLLIPEAHPIARDQVRKAWDAQMRAVEETDWVSLQQTGKTRYRLGPTMCAGEYAAVVLQHLVSERATPTTVLEIGLFAGTTTMALALLETVTEVTALDIEPFLEQFDRPAWEQAGVSDKIKTVFGPATESMKSFAASKRKFDVVFIDADKPNYQTYVELLLELDLLSQDGTVYADNTLYKGFVITDSDREQEKNKLQAHQSNNKSLGEATQGIVDFNNWVRDNKALTSAMLPVRDGLTVIKRRR